MSTPGLLSEQVIPLGAAASAFPIVGGRQVKLKSLLRWVHDGVLVKGVRVRLEAARIGGRWVTSGDAVSRFIEATTAVASPAQTSPTPAKRRAASRAAGARVRIMMADV